MAVAIFVANIAPGNGVTAGCTVADYKSAALPVMSRYNVVIKNLIIDSQASRNTAAVALRQLRHEAGDIDCRDDYPLKQETLEMAINHTMSALVATDNADFIGASQALDRALLNVRRFQDWSTDID